MHTKYVLCTRRVKQVYYIDIPIYLTDIINVKEYMFVHLLLNHALNYDFDKILYTDRLWPGLSYRILFIQEKPLSLLMII